MEKKSNLYIWSIISTVYRPYKSILHVILNVFLHSNLTHQEDKRDKNAGRVLTELSLGKSLFLQKLAFILQCCRQSTVHVIHNLMVEQHNHHPCSLHHNVFKPFKPSQGFFMIWQEAPCIHFSLQWASECSHLYFILQMFIEFIHDINCVLYSAY